MAISGTGPAFASATNLYIPSWVDSGRVTIGFSRNPKMFPYNKYISYANVKKNRGYYMQWTQQAQARVLNVDAWLWAYNQDRPVPANPEAFTNVQYTLVRRDYAYGSDHDTLSQADFNYQQVLRDTHAQLAATSRAYRIGAVMTTTSNWASSAYIGGKDMSLDHFSTAANASGGGLFDAGTSTNPYFMKGIDYALDKISLDTNGALTSQPGRMCLVMNPTTARKIAASQEMKDFLKGSPYALPSITGSIFEQKNYGLPPTFQECEVVVDNSVYVSSEVGATVARSYIIPDSDVVLMYRPDSLDGVYGEKPFSTITVFYRANPGSGGSASNGGDGRNIDSTGIDLVVTEFEDLRNDRWEGHITEETQEILTAPQTGWLFTSCVT